MFDITGHSSVCLSVAQTVILSQDNDVAAVLDIGEYRTCWITPDIAESPIESQWGPRQYPS